jgi:hypothetical protein
MWFIKKQWRVQMFRLTYTEPHTYSSLVGNYLVMRPLPMTSFDSLKIKNQNQTAGALSYLKTLKGLSVLMCKDLAVSLVCWRWGGGMVD